MQEILEKANGLLYDKFKVRPLESKLIECSEEELKKVVHGCNNNVSGFKNDGSQRVAGLYSPFKKKGYVLKNDISAAFHEFCGHGVFYEHSIFGKEFCDFLQFAHLAQIKEQRKYSIMHEGMLSAIEGHALWVQDLLLRDLGDEDLLFDFYVNVATTPFYNRFIKGNVTYGHLLATVKKLEINVGVHGMWYGFGFPVSFDRETLIEVAKEKLKDDFDNLQALILMGSRNPYSDLDLCAILSGDFDKVKGDDDRIDFATYSLDEFIAKADLFDPGVTEALLTGDCVFGDSNLFENLKKGVLKCKPSNNAVDYLSRRSGELFDVLSGVSISRENVKFILVNLSYAFSFRILAEKYSQGSGVLTLNDINDGNLKEVRDCLKEVKNGVVLSSDKVKSLISSF